MSDVEECEEDRSVGKVLWHAILSLDGFIAGPGDLAEETVR